MGIIPSTCCFCTHSVPSVFPLKGQQECACVCDGWGGCRPFTHSNTHFRAHTHSAPVTHSLSEQEKGNFSHEEEPVGADVGHNWLKVCCFYHHTVLYSRWCRIKLDKSDKLSSVFAVSVWKRCKLDQLASCLWGNISTTKVELVFCDLWYFTPQFCHFLNIILFPNPVGSRSETLKLFPLFSVGQ